MATTMTTYYNQKQDEFSLEIFRVFSTLFFFSCCTLVQYSTGAHTTNHQYKEFIDLIVGDEDIQNVYITQMNERMNESMC